jgi:hypothetical protein
MVKSFERGHEIVYLGQWVYADTKELINGKRVCKRCKCNPTLEGYDACLGHIDGIISACCGHGVEKPYIIKKRKREG